MSLSSIYLEGNANDRFSTLASIWRSWDPPALLMVINEYKAFRG